MSSLSLANKTAVITGAGRGLGRAYAEELARRGARVLINDMSQPDADDAVRSIADAGGRAVADYSSIATPQGGADVIDHALDEFGRIDLLVNNAGILRPGLFEDLTIERITAVIDTHLMGSIYVTQPAWREMQRRGGGRVVMTSSSSGMFSHQGLSNYAAAKAGIFGLTKALAYEGQKHGIFVNAIMPHAATTIARNEPIPGYAEALEAALGPARMFPRDHPRWRPEAVAPFVAYLASDACELTGEAFGVGFGRVARIFVGMAEGWMAEPDEPFTAETVLEHIDEIRSLDKAWVPDWIYDELRNVRDRMPEQL